MAKLMTLKPRRNRPRIQVRVPNEALNTCGRWLILNTCTKQLGFLFALSLASFAVIIISAGLESSFSGPCGGAGEDCGIDSPKRGNIRSRATRRAGTRHPVNLSLI